MHVKYYADVIYFSVMRCCTNFDLLFPYYTRFDYMARFVTEIGFNWRSMHIRENLDITFIVPAYNTLIYSDPRGNVSLLCFYCSGCNVFGHSSPVIANSSAKIYFPSEQIIN